MRRNLEHTFLILQDRYPDRSVLSIRKQFCLAYLEWKTRCHKHLKQPWVDLAVELRKGENKIGGKRTKLERLARRHFQERRKHIGCTPSREAAREFALKQVKEKTGIHSPEARAKQREIARASRARQEAENRSPSSAEWVITCREGGEFRIRNLTAFCREHNINYRNLHFTAVSNYWAKGFRARKYDPLIDSHIPTREEFEKGR
jgi:hypothetical protein